mmetsp:Transcript_38734/g.97011  ORF Transcript_38734/g.97011 Transcript_38734/m.97011 type:complete len:274 (-) Transcript_38734:61-882(-)
MPGARARRPHGLLGRARLLLLMPLPVARGQERVPHVQDDTGGAEEAAGHQQRGGEAGVEGVDRSAEGREGIAEAGGDRGSGGGGAGQPDCHAPGRGAPPPVAPRERGGGCPGGIRVEVRQRGRPVWVGVHDTLPLCVGRVRRGVSRQRLVPLQDRHRLDAGPVVQQLRQPGGLGVWGPLPGHDPRGGGGGDGGDQGHEQRPVPDAEEDRWRWVQGVPRHSWGLDLSRGMVGSPRQDPERPLRASFPLPRPGSTVSRQLPSHALQQQGSLRCSV